MSGGTATRRALHSLRAGNRKRHLPGTASTIKDDSTDLLGGDRFKTKEVKQQWNSYSSLPDNNMEMQKRSAQTAASPIPEVSLPATSVTSWIADLVSGTSLKDLSDRTVHRSKRMILDTLGVGFLGHQTDITQTVAKTCLHLENSTNSQRDGAIIWGSRQLKASPTIAAYINGVSCHSMDFDDTWNPATHPSGPTLPAVLALGEAMPDNMTASLNDVLVAYNVGVQVQGLLLRSADSAKKIPWRFHPPAVVGVMGSAAACSNFLGLSPLKCRNALGIAASFAGAPMANAGTTTKPLHAGKAARFGLEAALLADRGLEGNYNILDMPSGFGAFYDDFDPETLIREHCGSKEFLLHDQDIALKRFPAHLGMHWTIDAALAIRDSVQQKYGHFDAAFIKQVTIKTPKSKYINRPLPASTHEARHSFQFNGCTALLDGEVTPDSYEDSYRRRPQLYSLLKKTMIETPDDNKPSFQEMYVEVHIRLQDGTEFQGRCDTPYGHWRNPLSDADVVQKFATNTKTMDMHNQQKIVDLVKEMSDTVPPSDLTKLLHLG